jgi:glycosyltransferase involved in cell wall biosynthesis
MAEGVKESIKNINKKIEIVSNCSDIDRFSPAIDAGLIRKENGWENKFILLHFGAMGRANGLEFLINAASMLKQKEDIQFVVIGDGSEKNRLIERAKKLSLNNIEFLGSIPKNRLPQFVAAADVSLVIFADYPILEHNSANKFFDSLAAGKPVLLIIPDGKERSSKKRMRALAANRAT